ncbi:hypothetical protein AGMMS50249_0710 [candidate division SR1 bacterium]|nr:hypothetical protein AGMMS50249_0710 [candidate division SR1 bacterium]
MRYFSLFSLLLLPFLTACTINISPKLPSVNIPVEIPADKQELLDKAFASGKDSLNDGWETVKDNAEILKDKAKATANQALTEAKNQYNSGVDKLNQDLQNQAQQQISDGLNKIKFD